MKFQDSLEPRSLIAGLTKNTATFGWDDQENVRVQRLRFINKEDAQTAQNILIALLSEDDASQIRLVPFQNIEGSVTHHDVTVPSAMLPQLKKGIRRCSPEMQSEPNPAGFVEQLSARSSMSGLRGGSDDPSHPEKSLNNFMAPLAILERPFDLCERLVHARKKAGGNRHKYYASKGSYGILFDTQDDAENAKRILGALAGNKSTLTVDCEEIKHKTHYWLNVPSDEAAAILQEARTLSAMLVDTAQAFSAGDTSKAEQERTDLLDLIKGMGLGDSHIAEQMTRRVLAKKEVARQ